MASYTLLALGPASPESDQEWLACPHISDIFQHHRAALNGRRFGSRVLGIGLDSLVLAIRTLRPSVKGPYVANNPWIGAALRLTGRRNFVVTGIYAEPSSPSWKVLRRLIGDAPVIALSESEAGPWNADGGRAQAVLYGNSFGYPAKNAPQHLHIFVGGTSDRDTGIIRALEAEVLNSAEPVHLTLATGEPAGEIRHDGNVVSRPGYLTPKAFGELLSTASVAFLPIRQGTRAAGHMVLVGALESGVAVGVTPSEGMKEYVIGPAVAGCDPNQPIIPQLRRLVDQPASQEESIRQFWADTFSLSSYVSRVGAVLEEVNKRRGT